MEHLRLPPRRLPAIIPTTQEKSSQNPETKMKLSISNLGMEKRDKSIPSCFLTVSYMLGPGAEHTQRTCASLSPGPSPQFRSRTDSCPFMLSFGQQINTEHQSHALQLDFGVWVCSLLCMPEC